MKKILVTLGAIVILHACTANLIDAPVKLKIEYGDQVTDEIIPRFSWVLNDSSRGAAQTKYQIIVASSEKLLTAGKADMWNSGKVDSDQSVFVDYQGEPLQSQQRYFWTMRVWNQHGTPSAWSSVHYFDMGILYDSAWIGKWIGAKESSAQTDTERPRSIMLRKDLEIRREFKIAKAYVTGLGSYQFFLNGRKVSDDLLTPGWTDYPTRILYQVYDVTAYLEEGINGAGMMLGNVWYSSGLGWQGGSVYSDGPMMGLLQLEVEYEDGTLDRFTTDESWKWKFSPITENTLYHGETYDARLEIAGWNKAGLDDSDWDQVDLFDNEKAVLSAHTSPKIRVTREIVPINTTRLKNGSYVFDMGVNITGGIRLQVQGDRGTEIVMKFAELLHDDGTVAQENLRTATATDRFILKGGKPETWEPAFTYHGFRYVEIEGLPSPPDSNTVTGINFHNAVMETGSFTCSNEMINTIQTNILNGQRSNLFSVPTDCPQRDERLGWMGDAQIFAATSCYNMDMSGFYAKWIRDIADSQSEEGWVTDVNPAIVVTTPAKPAWGDAFIIMPWEMYRFYNDRRILEKFYDDYKEWVEYMRNNVEQDGLYIYDDNGWGGYADWIAVVKSPEQPVSAAYYYYSTSLLANFAGILGYTDDQSTYNTLAAGIRDAFHKRYFDEQKATYKGETQTAMLLPLNLGLTPGDKIDAVAENIKYDVEGRGNHPTTGFLGTKYLLPTLSDFGYHETAYKTAINEEYPSWGYMAVNGATSMWELWNSDSEPPDQMNSRNHFALGSIGEWFYSHLAGIRLDDKHPGFKHSIISPMPAEGLDWARGEIMTPYGILKSAWEKTDESFLLHVCIPPNTTSTIIIPVAGGEVSELIEGGTTSIIKDNHTVDGVNSEIDIVETDGDQIVLKVGSGIFKFELLY
ncbi:MAG: family 78 glycoside hydrolase catalytic domain [Bacteroidales bacterium]